MTTQIRSIRTRNQLSQGKLAHLTGLSPSHLSRLERGRRSTTREVALAVARALGVEPARLFEERHIPKFLGSGEAFWRPLPLRGERGDE
jgi:transcriptional regulator with XRE-family HTH domain